VPFLSPDSFFGFPLTNMVGSTGGALLPDHFDGVDCVFALITLYLIIKFVNSLRPILGD
jgi:hypothetical protein